MAVALFEGADRSSINVTVPPLVVRTLLCHARKRACNEREYVTPVSHTQRGAITGAVSFDKAQQCCLERRNTPEHAFRQCKATQATLVTVKV